MRKLAILFFLTVLAIGAYAQAPIEGFWNVKLGEERNSVINKIKQKYPNASWNYKTYSDKQNNNIDNASLVVGNAHLAGIKGTMTLEFSNGKLSNGTFSVGFRTEQPTYQNVQSFLQQKMQDVNNFYDVFSTAFKEKYGEPYSTENGVLTWRSSNGNKLQISPKYFIEELPWDAHDGYIGLNVSYLLGITVIDY